MVASASDQYTGSLRSGVFGPTVSGGKPRNGGPDWARIGILAVSIVTSFAVLIGSAYATLIFVELRQVEANAVDIVEGPEGGFVATTEDGPLVVPEVESEGDRKTILLVGSDSRAGLSREELDRIGTDDAGTDLTDTIILLQLDPDTDAAAMLSFPRDLLVERCDGSRGRINEAYFIGELQGEGLGPKCLVDTITALTRIEIDHYARVNFAGFVQAVDALGGVTFYIDQPLQDRYSGLDIPEGCVHFDGVTAIQFVRARRLDNDFGRIARQQRFAREMINKATSVGTLANPIRVTQLITSVSDVIETDQNFGVREMAALASSVQGISSGGVDARTVPAVFGSFGAASVVYAVEEEAERLFDAFRSGELLPDNVGTDGGPVDLGPANVVPINVRNGAGGDGLAEETAEVLEALGFAVSSTGVNENYGFDSSLVLHPPDRRDHAEIVAEALGGLTVNTGSADLDELTLILGGTFDPSPFAPEPAPGDPEVTDDAGDAEDAEDESEGEFVGAEVSEVQC